MKYFSWNVLKYYIELAFCVMCSILNIPQSLDLIAKSTQQKIFKNVDYMSNVIIIFNCETGNDGEVF